VVELWGVIVSLILYNFAPFVTCDDCGGVTTRRVRNAIFAGIFRAFSMLGLTLPQM
jgi:hypothetical protein